MAIEQCNALPLDVNNAALLDPLRSVLVVIYLPSVLVVCVGVQFSSMNFIGYYLLSSIIILTVQCMDQARQAEASSQNGPSFFFSLSFSTAAQIITLRMGWLGTQSDPELN